MGSIYLSYLMIEYPTKPHHLGHLPRSPMNQEFAYDLMEPFRLRLETF